MELNANTKATIAALHEELDAIHFANELYWKCEDPTAVARAEYELRQERLEEVRELIQSGF